jgi:hypothetical protein
MTSRLALLALVPLSAPACLADHPAGAVEVGGGDCYSCHRPDYEATTMPAHPGMFPTTCADCHMTSAWQPALGGAHPESAFPIRSGPHSGFGCFDCHDPENLGPSSVDGANTDCIGCHTGEHSRTKMDEKHQEEPGYVWDDGMPHFCLTCHPTGRGD